MSARSKRFSKRFKKFHSPSRRIHRHIKGLDAEKEMLRILKENVAAQNLAKEVASFYGDNFRFYKDTSYSKSRYTIAWDHEPVKLRFVAIHLQIGTNRIAEALTHELLHLRLLIQGFPSCEKVFVSDEQNEYAKDFIDTIDKIGNLVDHELIYHQFLEIGFEDSNFLGPSSPVPNYEKLIEDVISFQKQPTPVNFPWWCLEYYRHWVSARHGLSQDTLCHAESAEHLGSKIHSDLPEALNMMRDWTLKGEFRDTDKYPIEMNRLLSIMKLPQVTGWAALRIKEPGKFIAVNL